MVKYFKYFKSDKICRVIKNIWMVIPDKRYQVDPNVMVLVPSVPPIPPCVVSEKCNIGLEVASEVFHYYMLINCKWTPSNKNYYRVLKGFNVEWESLEKISKQSIPDFPTLFKIQTPLHRIESLRISSNFNLGLIIYLFYMSSYTKCSYLMRL